jgi:hypothetical protein
MPCTHIKHLSEYCRTHDLKVSSSDLLRIVCPQCGMEEVCPSLPVADYDERHPQPEPATSPQNVDGKQLAEPVFGTTRTNSA